MKEGETVREKQGRDDEYQMSKDSPHKCVTRSGLSQFKETGSDVFVRSIEIAL